MNFYTELGLPMGVRSKHSKFMRDNGFSSDAAVVQNSAVVHAPPEEQDDSDVEYCTINIARKGGFVGGGCAFMIDIDMGPVGELMPNQGLTVRVPVPSLGMIRIGVSVMGMVHRGLGNVT